MFRDEDVLGAAERLGDLIRRRLDTMRSSGRFECIGEVRGLGAMLAMELVTDRATKEPAPDLTRRVVANAAERGLIVISCGIYSNVIRVMVPLVASLELVDEGLAILEDSLAGAITAPA